MILDVFLASMNIRILWWCVKFHLANIEESCFWCSSNSFSCCTSSNSKPWLLFHQKFLFDRKTNNTYSPNRYNTCHYVASTKSLAHSQLFILLFWWWEFGTSWVFYLCASRFNWKRDLCSTNENMYSSDARNHCSIWKKPSWFWSLHKKLTFCCGWRIVIWSSLVIDTLPTPTHRATVWLPALIPTPLLTSDRTPISNTRSDTNSNTRANIISKLGIDTSSCSSYTRFHLAQHWSFSHLVPLNPNTTSDSCSNRNMPLVGVLRASGTCAKFLLASLSPVVEDDNFCPSSIDCCCCSPPALLSFPLTCCGPERYFVFSWGESFDVRLVATLVERGVSSTSS